jgi:hypothetical protein
MKQQSSLHMYLKPWLLMWEKPHSVIMRYDIWSGGISFELGSKPKLHICIKKPQVKWTKYTSSLLSTKVTQPCTPNHIGKKHLPINFAWTYLHTLIKFHPISKLHKTYNYSLKQNQGLQVWSLNIHELNRAILMPYSMCSFKKMKVPL